MKYILFGLAMGWFLHQLERWNSLRRNRREQEQWRTEQLRKGGK